MRDSGQELEPSVNLGRNEVEEKKLGDGTDGTPCNHLLLFAPFWGANTINEQ